MKTMRSPLTKFAAALMFLTIARSSLAAEFAFGADLSFLKRAEDGGTVFKDHTNALAGLQVFRNHGYNWIRLRIFVDPVGENLPNNLAYTLAVAQDAKKLGYKFLLDFHYASSWADPAKQPTPDPWKNLTHKQRVQAVFQYTLDTLKQFHDAGVPPPEILRVVRTEDLMWEEAGELPGVTNKVLARMIAAGEPLEWVEIEL